MVEHHFGFRDRRTFGRIGNRSHDRAVYYFCQCEIDRIGYRIGNDHRISFPIVCIEGNDDHIDAVWNIFETVRSFLVGKTRIKTRDQPP